MNDADPALCAIAASLPARERLQPTQDWQHLAQLHARASEGEARAYSALLSSCGPGGLALARNPDPALLADWYAATTPVTLAWESPHRYAVGVETTY